MKKTLRENKYLLFPKRFHNKGHWWLVEYWMKRYCALMNGPFHVGEVSGMGLGLFATTRVKKGSTLLFGHLHRVTHKTTMRLDAAGETSLMQLQQGKRIHWYYMGGPASLVNHACRSFNAEYLFGTRRGEQGEFLIQLTRDVAPGDEILVHYGDEFWNAQNSNLCLCQDCKKKCIKQKERSGRKPKKISVQAKEATQKN